MKSMFLIRDPQHIITSYIKIIEEPILPDIGLKEEFEVTSRKMGNNQCS
ncbi:MAG: hypothetical protein R8G66_02960 [Cytophagales bacterium]|nr:hypothetical protein [Cytophagales bacterium]